MTAGPGSKTPAWLLLGVVCAAQFLDGMDVASLAPALPEIQRDLQIAPEDLQWVVTAYVLGYGGFLLLGGRVADLRSRRLVFLVSLAVFAIASLVGGLADGAGVLIAARFVKGVAAAFTAPAALAILLARFQDPGSRARALGVFTSAGAAGFTLGLVLGGALATSTWRLTLLMPALAAALLVVLGRVVIERDAADRVGASSGVGGALTVTLGLLGLVFALTRSQRAGWLSPMVLGLLAASALLLVAFVALERRRPDPLVPVGLRRTPGLFRANAVAFLMQGSYVGFQFVATLYYQHELDWSPLQTGLAFLAGGLLVTVLAPAFARRAASHGPWPLATLGMALQAVSLVTFLRLDGASGLDLVLVQQVLGGVGYTAVYAAVYIAAVSGAREREEGVASALLIAATQIGSGVVLAVVASAFAASGRGGLDPYRAGLIVAIAVLALGTATAATGLRGRVRQTPERTG